MDGVTIPTMININDKYLKVVEKNQNELINSLSTESEEIKDIANLLSTIAINEQNLNIINDMVSKNETIQNGLKNVITQITEK